jgi:CheY-like chemotaxis protein
MRAVVLIEEAADREAIARALQRAGFSVVSAADRATAVAAVAREAPEAVVFSWINSEFVRDVRVADGAGKALLVALLDSANDGGGISPVLATGVNDILIRPFVESELVARLRAGFRSGRRIPSPPAPAGDGLPRFDVRRLAMWRNLGPTVAADLEEMMGRPLRATPGWPDDPAKPLRCAKIPMLLVHEGVELLVSVAADAPTQAWLANVLLEDASPTEAVVQDVLRELASTAGGAFKRLALQESVSVTTGLPVNVAAIPSPSAAAIGFGLHPASEKATLFLFAEMQRRVNRQVRASELGEGMVVVHDVRGTSGALLVTGGSRLTRTTAERLRGMLPGRSLVEVV